MDKLLKTSDLYEILPFKKQKVLKLLNSGQFPAVKVGKDYITTYEQINTWLEKNKGKEIFID